MIAIHINPSIIKSDKLFTKEQKKEILGLHSKAQKAAPVQNNDKK